MLLTLTGICIAFISFGQQKASGKAVINTPGVHCEMSRDKIEKYLARQYGVSSVKVDYKKKITTVAWLTDRTNIEEIKASIANTGYDADDVSAEEGAYKRLPACCRKPAETKN